MEIDSHHRTFMSWKQVQDKAEYFRYLSVIFIDDLVKLVDKANDGRRIEASRTVTFFADNIILFAPSVHVLQSLVNSCDSELMRYTANAPLLRLLLRLSVCLSVCNAFELRVNRGHSCLLCVCLLCFLCLLCCMCFYYYHFFGEIKISLTLAGLLFPQCPTIWREVCQDVKWRRVCAMSCYVVPFVTFKLRTVHEMRDIQYHACALNNFVVISRDTLQIFFEHFKIFTTTW